MQHTDKARAEFEAVYALKYEQETGHKLSTPLIELREGDHYGADRTYLNAAWEWWQASRASVVVELPEPREGRRTYLDDDARDEGWNDCLAECREAFEATGLTVEG